MFFSCDNDTITKVNVNIFLNIFNKSHRIGGYLLFKAVV